MVDNKLVLGSITLLVTGILATGIYYLEQSKLVKY